MVAPQSAPEFRAGQRVRLRVGFLAWPADPGAVYAHAGRTHALATSTLPTFLTCADPLVFVAYRSEKPGGAVVRDEHGDAWNVPEDYLAPRTRN
ncbi:hypothetical protein J8F10_13365 [Gemmata sp. G18]|uniref:Uncharacterized protein n=1 Tax=Gemmata palustris TaxID=2822762 RepID=A0ABS5BRG8_9BACT|nr:hypothetical protein [Gemmata palustris]MBP3956273.1 hypothetical protein [Gemmata palustris]